MAVHMGGDKSRGKIHYTTSDFMCCSGTYSTLKFHSLNQYSKKKKVTENFCSLLRGPYRPQTLFYNTDVDIQLNRIETRLSFSNTLRYNFYYNMLC